MIIEALMQVEEEQHAVDWTQQTFKIVDLSLSRSIILPDEAPIEIFISLRPVQRKPQSKVFWFEFTVSSLRDGIATTHCRGRATTLPSTYFHLQSLSLLLTIFFSQGESGLVADETVAFLRPASQHSRRSVLRLSQ